MHSDVQAENTTGNQGISTSGMNKMDTSKVSEDAIFIVHTKPLN